MIVLQNKQLSLLKQKIDKMISMLKTQDVFATAKFKPTLQIISNNINQCIINDFDEIGRASCRERVSERV